jgi:hypothetical protein
MVKITLNGSTSERKLVAVVGVNGVGIFLPASPELDEGFGLVWYNTITGKVESCRGPLNSLEGLLAQEKDRQPVYEGDSITLEF